MVRRGEKEVDTVVRRGEKEVDKVVKEGREGGIYSG